MSNYDMLLCERSVPVVKRIILVLVVLGGLVYTQAEDNTNDSTVKTSVEKKDGKKQESETQKKNTSIKEEDEKNPTSQLKHYTKQQKVRLM